MRNEGYRPSWTGYVCSSPERNDRIVSESTAAGPNPTAPRIPPGPDGHLPLDVVRDAPLTFLMDTAATYGDIFRYRADRWAVVVLNRAEYVKHALEDHTRTYVKSGTPDLLMLKPMLGDGLLTTEGDVWLKQRRQLQPLFGRDRVASYDELIVRATDRMLSDWESSAAAGTAVDIEAEMTRLTLSVVSQALFNWDTRDNDAGFSDAMRDINECTARYQPGDSAQLLRFNRARTTMRALVQSVRSGALADPEANAGDMLSILLNRREGAGGAMTDRLVNDQIFTFLIAGHETTSKALTWTLCLLDQHRDAAERLRAEMQTVLGNRRPTAADLADLPFLGWVLDEAMRLYPPVWAMTRRCQGGDVIDGYRVPPNALVIVSPYLMHRHPRYWEAPETFDPERFSPERSAGRPPYAFIPFSGGPRLCIGRSLATLETRLVLARVLQRYAPRLVPGHPVEPEALVTLRPKYGLPMLLEEAPV